MLIIFLAFIFFAAPRPPQLPTSCAFTQLDFPFKGAATAPLGLSKCIFSMHPKPLGARHGALFRVFQPQQVFNMQIPTKTAFATMYVLESVQAFASLGGVKQLMLVQKIYGSLIIYILSCLWLLPLLHLPAKKKLLGALQITYIFFFHFRSFFFLQVYCYIHFQKKE